MLFVVISLNEIAVDVFTSKLKSGEEIKGYFVI